MGGHPTALFKSTRDYQLICYLGVTLDLLKIFSTTCADYLKNVRF